MDKREFLKTCKELYKRGYRRNFKMRDLYNSDHTGLFYHYYKVMDRQKDKYGNSRAINQILFRPWSYWEFRDRLPNSNNWISFEPVILFSREVDETIELRLQFPERSIDEIEEIAKKLGEFIKKNIKPV